ncbi:14760_t:CDS:2, partial [Acaulospora colombiana]
LFALSPSHLVHPKKRLSPCLKILASPKNSTTLSVKEKTGEFLLPEGYTFNPGGQPMNQAAFRLAETLMKEADRRDPDAHAIMSADYLGYGVLDLIHGVLDSVYKKSSKKEWMDSWHELTALSILMNSFSDFMTIDDGDTVMAADKVFGALVVKVLKALEPEFAEKGEAELPDLEFCLHSMADVGDMTSDFGGGKYTKILKSYARHLFGRQSQEYRQARIEAIKRTYQKFYQTLPNDKKQEYVDKSV